MIYLKKINLEDVEEEYRAISIMPEDENGFINPFFGCTFEEFRDELISKAISQEEGNGLPEGWVPQTVYFLWDDDKIVGMYKCRHYLNEVLRNSHGHIGVGILPDARGKGYGEKGLKLAIEELSKIIPEDEIYLEAYKDNIASIKMQQKCGAKIVGEHDNSYLLRAPKIINE